MNILFKRLIFALPFVLMPLIANAHVKWFAPYDLTKAPRSLMGMLSTEAFIFLGIVSLAVTYLSSSLDLKLIDTRSRLSKWFEKKDKWMAINSYLILRCATSFMFFSASLYGTFYITPELLHTTPWVRYLQLGIAILILFKKTGFVAGLGIVILFGMSLNAYGPFHMADYPIFIGASAYMMMRSLGCTERRAFIVVRATAAVTLMIGGAEKFGYPEWSFLLLDRKPELAFGFGNEFFMLAAGFVEFCAAFLLLSGRIAGRFSALLLLILFAGAVIPFGLVDLVGHALIIAMLFVMIFNDNPIAIAIRRPSIKLTAISISTVFTASLFVFILGYSTGYELLQPKVVGKSELANTQQVLIQPQVVKNSDLANTQATLIQPQTTDKPELSKSKPLLISVHDHSTHDHH